MFGLWLFVCFIFYGGELEFLDYLMNLYKLVIFGDINMKRKKIKF